MRPHVYGDRARDAHPPEIPVGRERRCSTTPSPTAAKPPTLDRAARYQGLAPPMQHPVGSANNLGFRPMGSEVFTPSPPHPGGAAGTRSEFASKACSRPHRSLHPIAIRLAWPPSDPVVTLGGCSLVASTAASLPTWLARWNSEAICPEIGKPLPVQQQLESKGLVTRLRVSSQTGSAGLSELLLRAQEHRRHPGSARYREHPRARGAARSMHRCGRVSWAARTSPLRLRPETGGCRERVAMQSSPSRPVAVGRNADFVADKAPFTPEFPPSEA